MARIEDVLNELAPWLDDVHAVGGCVRDTQLGIEPKDIDIASPLPPEEVAERCRERGIRTIDTGIAHGTITLVLPPGVLVEHTTYRCDVATDGRHAKIAYAATIEADLGRRDFTVNAMAVNRVGTIIDPYNGMPDLAVRRIRCVGDPETRFREDLLRIIRAGRFASTLQFEIDSETRQAMRVVAPVLCENVRLRNGPQSKRVSVERILHEFDKAFAGGRPDQFLQDMFDLRVVQTLIPELALADTVEQNPLYHPEGSVWEHVKCVVRNAVVVDTIALKQGEIGQRHRWAALLHDVGKPVSCTVGPDGQNHFYKHEALGAELIETDIAVRLHFSNELRDELVTVTRLHMRPFQLLRQDEVTERAMRRMANDAGDHLNALKELALADAAGRREREAIEALFDLPEVQEPPARVLTGKHLIEAGYKPGVPFGSALNAAFEYQLDTGETDVDNLLAIARQHLDARA